MHVRDCRHREQTEVVHISPRSYDNRAVAARQNNNVFVPCADLLPLVAMTRARYDLYRRVDLDKDHAINLDEAVYFARMCFEDACGNLNLWMH